MAKTSRAAKTVSIACKLPQGLHIHLPGQVQPVVLHGSASPYAIAGHGITAGVPVDVWEAIKTLHNEAKWLTNGFVFANGEPRDTADEAAERKDTKAGFEPIDPASLTGNLTTAE